MSDGSRMIVREALPSDAQGIARTHVDSWRETYSGVLDDAIGPDAEHGFTPVRPLHMFSIYLLAAAHGTGGGQSLLDAVVGAEPAQLWVLHGNARAISFYKRNGFAFDGVEYTDPADAKMVELRMVR